MFHVKLLSSIPSYPQRGFAVEHRACGYVPVSRQNASFQWADSRRGTG
jgi:hypothetical protein